MGQEALLKRIAERLATLGRSERQAVLKAEVGVDFVRDIRHRGHSPKVDKLARLAKALGKPLSYFTEVIVPDSEETNRDAVSTISITSIHVIGDVQAGVWREATEWPADDWYSVTVPTNKQYPGCARFGLEVKGRCKCCVVQMQSKVELRSVVCFSLVA